MKKFFRSFFGRLLLTVLICTAVLSVVGSFSSGFTNFNVKEWGDKELNSANLFTKASYTILDGNDASGLSVRIDEDGVIKLSGSVTEDTTLTVGTVTLNAGTYTIGGYNSSSSVKLAVKNGSDIYYAGTTGATFTLSAQASVQVQIIVTKDTRVIVPQTIRPTIGTGNAAVDFFA